jgi:opacity protein-like surface antigen
MFIRTAATLGFIALFATPAAAQDGTSQTGPYASLSGAYVFSEELGTNIGIEAETEDGFAVAAAVGQAFGPFRAELEGSYRKSGVDRARGLGLVVQGAGEVSALSAMANVYFSPDVQLGPVRPYIGAGAGISRFKARDVEAVGVAGLGPVSASETGFAYQLMAGGELAMSEAATLTAGYRYFATPDVDANVAPFGPVTIDGLGLHELVIGLRFGF